MILNDLLFIIPARKSSIRLKDKNIRKIGGKTLVQWSIDFALISKISLFNIIVSTDSEKIINLSKRKCVLFIKRNRKLSGKNAKSVDVILSTLNWYKKNYKERFSKIKAIALLQPTSPFRSYKVFIKAYKFFLKKKADNVFSATSTSIQKKTQNNFLKKNIKPNGNFYITRLKFFLRNKSLFLGNSYGYIIRNKNLLVDIDTLKDYQKAKFLLRKFRASIKSNSILS